jgi:CubicO group peptidase (beta-lactamase class C family)
MPFRSSRRSFLIRGAKAAVAVSLVPLTACTRREPEAQPQALPGSLIADFESQIPAWLTAAKVPGLSIAIVRNARIAWTRGFGVKDATTNAAVDDQTLFEAGSISKTVFAYAVMKLHETGVLNLDAPLASYIPDRWIADDPRFAQITARQVLSHTTGLPNWRSAREPLRIHFPPGSAFQYSGEGYSYLQLVVSRLAGHVDEQACETLFDGARVCATDIDVQLKAKVLHPFGMTSSGYLWETSSPHVARAHDRGGKPTNRPGATPIMAARYAAAGGLSTTATEYAKFLIEVIDPKPADAFRLNAATHAAMIRPQVRVDGLSSWALGWRIVTQHDGDLISHGGDNPGFKSLTMASPRHQSGYVIFTNGDNGGEVIGKLTNGDTPLNRLLSG